MASFKSLVFAAVLAAALSVCMGLGRQRRDLLAFGGGLVEALEEAACLSSCEVANDDDTNDSIFGASCSGGDGSSALKACCAKCGDPTSSVGKPGTPCTDVCDNTKGGDALYCVTDEYLATESDGSKFCSCQNRHFRTEDKWSADYDKGEGGPDRRKQTRTVLIVFSSLAFVLFVLSQLVLFQNGSGYSTPIYDPSGSDVKFLGIVIFFYSVLCGVLGLVFARYGLLEASSITTYSSTYGCLQYNEDDDDNNYFGSYTFNGDGDFGYGYADAWTGWGSYWFFVHLCLPGIVFGATEYVERNTERNPQRQISLNPGMKVRPDQVQWDKAPRMCIITARNRKEGGWDDSRSRREVFDVEFKTGRRQGRTLKNVDKFHLRVPPSSSFGLTIHGVAAFALLVEMSAIIAVGANAHGHTALVGYGVFVMIGISLLLFLPPILYWFYAYQAASTSFASGRGIASKIGLFIAATLSLFALIYLATSTTPEYITATVNGTGTVDELESQDALQAANKENEKKALTTFAIIGSVVTVGLLAHFGTHPLTRDYELYLLVWGGLLDATTDILYMMMEVFSSKSIFAACASIILLPLVMVALSFWPLMTHEYKNQKWRYIFLPFEGALLLLVLPFISTANIVPAFSASVFSVGYEIAKTIYDKMYVEITEKQTERRGDDGKQRHFKKKLKFYHRGVFEALLAFLAPVAILIIAVVGFAATAVGTAIMFAFVLAGPMAIALVFSIMAFLRLFVLFPAVWEELYYFACWFARMARERVPVDDFMDDDRLEKAKGQVFRLYDASSAKDAKADMKDSTIKYLFVEFLLEALPQLIIQGINNNQTDNWSNISIISMSISGIIILNSVIKYGSLYCLVDEEEVFGGFEDENEGSEEGKRKQAGRGGVALAQLTQLERDV